MPTVYADGIPDVADFTLRVYAAPGETPTESDFTDLGDGLLVTSNDDAVAGLPATMFLDGGKYAGGEIIEAADGNLWFAERAAVPPVDPDAIISGVVDEVIRQIDGLNLGSGRGGATSGRRNPAEGWENRSGGDGQKVRIHFQPETPGDPVTRITVPVAFKREVDTAAALAAGVTLTANDCLWNLPTRSLAGMTLRTGDRIEQLEHEQDIWVVNPGSAAVAGVFGEEVRAICHQE